MEIEQNHFRYVANTVSPYETEGEGEKQIQIIPPGTIKGYLPVPNVNKTSDILT